MAFPRMRIGLEQPASTEQQLKIQADVSAMRKAITFGQRDSALINRCLQMAAHNGLSGEETYVALAYYALVQLEGMWEQTLRFSALDIRAPIVKPSAESESEQ